MQQDLGPSLVNVNREKRADLFLLIPRCRWKQMLHVIEIYMYIIVYKTRVISEHMYL